MFNSWLSHCQSKKMNFISAHHNIYSKKKFKNLIAANQAFNYLLENKTYTLLSPSK